MLFFIKYTIDEIDTKNWTIPAISVTRNGVGFKSVEATSNANAKQPSIIFPKQSNSYTLNNLEGRVIKNDREIFLSQRDMDAIKSQERIDDFKNFWIYGNNKVNVIIRFTYFSSTLMMLINIWIFIIKTINYSNKKYIFFISKLHNSFEVKYSNSKLNKH